MKKWFLVLMGTGLLFVAMLFASAQPALAQSDEPELKMSMSRDWGFSDGTGRIQGLFTLKITGPDTLTRVAFYIDDQVIGEDVTAPFALQFNTDLYPLGAHRLYALGYAGDGRELRSEVRQLQFVSADEGWKTGLAIAIPTLILILGAALLSIVVPGLLMRGKEKLPLGAERNYGVVGGTICPKCQRPFAMHLFAPNILVGKLDRCPYCGKWSVVRFKSIQELRAAEAAELAGANEQGQVAQPSEEEKLRKELDDSRFQGT